MSLFHNPVLLRPVDGPIHRRHHRVSRLQRIPHRSTPLCGGEEPGKGGYRTNLTYARPLAMGMKFTMPWD